MLFFCLFVFCRALGTREHDLNVCGFRAGIRLEKLVFVWFACLLVCLFVFCLTKATCTALPFLPLLFLLLLLLLLLLLPRKDLVNCQ